MPQRLIVPDASSPSRRLPGPHPLAVLALVLTSALVSEPLAAQVQLHTDFDLAGWRRNGVVTLTSDRLPAPRLERLVDGSTRTTVAVEGHGLVRLAIDFDPPQVVRKAGLRPAKGHEYEVLLDAVRSDGRRFGFGDKIVSDGAEALFRPIDAELSRLEFTVENLDPEPQGESVEIAEVRVGGQLIVLSLRLEGVPERLPAGGTFPVRVIGTDSHQGHPDLSNMAQLEVTPQRALKEHGRGQVEARIAGPIAIAPRIKQLTGETQHLLVIGLEPAPPSPTAFWGFTAVELRLAGDPPFEVFRRNPGDKQARSLGTVWSQHFLDDSIQPGMAYHYAYRRLDRLGNPATHRSDEKRVRTLAQPLRGQVDIGRLPVLVLLFTDSLGPAEAEHIVQSLEQARLFAYRHSGGRLVLENTYLAMSGPTPDTRGPSMDGIAARLEPYGIPDDAFGVIYAVANDLSGAHGNFAMLGRMGGAMGRGPGVPTPPGALGPDADVAYAFLHELHHVLAGRIAASIGHQDVASGDLAQDFRFGPLGSTRGRPFDSGEAWDGLAALYRAVSFWDEVGPPYRQPLEVIDRDGDGLVDDDPRVPLDEVGFGSNPALADSDGDGSNDADELRAGLYRWTDPLLADSDGDGLPDGADPWPLSDFSGVIPHAEQPQLLASRSGIQLAACWTAETLTLQVTTPEPVDVFVDLDGSGALGRWESDVIVQAPGLPSGSDVWAGPARLALRGQQEPRGVFIGERRLAGVVPEVEHLAAGFRLTVRLPAALGPGAADSSVQAGAPSVSGLRLQPGTVLGLALTVRPARAGGSPPFAAFAPWQDPVDDAARADPPWTSLFETHRLFDAVLLAEDEGD